MLGPLSLPLAGPRNGRWLQWTDRHPGPHLHAAKCYPRLGGHRNACVVQRREPMDGDVELLKRIYDRFNARDIQGVLTVLTDDVAWANGMDGGHVYGREAVREYWKRQWAIV